MKIKRNQIVVLLLVCALTLSVPMRAMAAENSQESEVMQPWYIYANSCDIELFIDNGVADIAVITYGTAAVGSISAYIYLQQYVDNRWTEVGHWSKGVTGRKLTFDTSQSVTAGEYRVVVSAYFYEKASPNSEHVTWNGGSEFCN